MDCRHGKVQAPRIQVHLPWEVDRDIDVDRDTDGVTDIPKIARSPSWSVGPDKSDQSPRAFRVAITAHSSVGAIHPFAFETASGSCH